MTNSVDDLPKQDLPSYREVYKCLLNSEGRRELIYGYKILLNLVAWPDRELAAGEKAYRRYIEISSGVTSSQSVVRRLAGSVIERVARVRVPDDTINSLVVESMRPPQPVEISESIRPIAPADLPEAA